MTFLKNGVGVKWVTHECPFLSYCQSFAGISKKYKSSSNVLDYPFLHYLTFLNVIYIYILWVFKSDLIFIMLPSFSFSQKLYFFFIINLVQCFSNIEVWFKFSLLEFYLKQSPILNSDDVSSKLSSKSGSSGRS